MRKPLISIVSGTFNEADNVEELYEKIQANIGQYRHRYDFEIIVIDNSSTDDTVTRLKLLAQDDRELKLIVNTRNFGHIRSPYWGILQGSGDAIIYLASDLQDPPELIPQFIDEWERGWKIVYAVKPTVQAQPFFNLIRKLYYRVLNSITEIDLVNDSTGFGIYDKMIIDQLRTINDPYPYLRGLVCSLGYPIKTIPFEQPSRKRGFTKNNFYTLYDIAMLGIVRHSMVPLRLASMLGFAISILSFLSGMVYTVLKLVYWNSFPIGVAPLVIGMFFLFGLLFGFIGLLGEYIGAILTLTQRHPVVVEKERINFE